jgi:hypothetical protein
MTAASRQVLPVNRSPGRAARCPGLGGEAGWRAKPAQGRGNLVVAGVWLECLVQVRGDLLLELARLCGRQAAHGRIKLAQVVADQPVIERGAAH